MPIEPRWLTMRREKTNLNDLLREQGVLFPPVPIRTILADLGIIVHELVDPGWAGACRTSEATGEATIWVRQEDPEFRKRFTLAHLLGHIVLHGKQPEFRDATFQGDPREVEANVFALTLLAPPLWVRRHMRDTDFKVEKMARLFGVSEAMIHRQLTRTLL